MIRQMSLFDAPRPIPTTDPSVKPESKPRLSRQCRLILSRLREGPATNGDLAGIALRFPNRIHELRRAGCVISLFEQNHKTGLTRYRLDFVAEGIQ